MGMRVTTGPMNIDNINGKTKVSQCSQWEKFDGATKAFFTIMGQI